MERVQALQHGTYVGRRLWLLGAGNTREGVDVVHHEERGARSEADETRSALAEQLSLRFCLAAGTKRPGLPPFPLGKLLFFVCIGITDVDQSSADAYWRLHSPQRGLARPQYSFSGQN